jgi:hypothetical protein
LGATENEATTAMIKHDYNILHDNEDDNNEPFKGC